MCPAAIPIVITMVDGQGDVIMAMQPHCHKLCSDPAESSHKLFTTYTIWLLYTTAVDFEARAPQLRASPTSCQLHASAQES